MNDGRSRFLLLLGSLLVAGCVAKGPEAVSVKAGPGIKVDPSTQAISVDQATVPMLPTCATGQFVTHSADGNWQCVTPAQVTDAQTVGGKPASYFLPATAKAADASLLNGKADTSFLAVGATAADSAKLNGKADTAFLAANGTAVNSAALSGHPSTDFLPIGGKAVAAATADRLGGVSPGEYVRNNLVNQTLPATVTIGDPSGTRIVLGANGTSGIQGSNVGSGNLHVDANSAGSDGRIYLNYFSGKGVAFANGGGAEVASVDSAGKMSAASFNGLQIFPVSSGSVGFDHGCDTLCSDAGGTCLISKLFPAKNSGTTSLTSCGSRTPLFSEWTFSCYCAKF